jgi:hypothetical protein
LKFEEEKQQRPKQDSADTQRLVTEIEMFLKASLDLLPGHFEAA